MQPSLPNGLELEHAAESLRRWAGRAGIPPGFPTAVLVMLYRDMARSDGWELQVKWDQAVGSLSARWQQNEREIGRCYHARSLDDARLIACAAHAHRFHAAP